ncbi:MAG TPA: hypothetical protein VN915_13210 [Elusimicrobiota bacterium]|nr:hypothetical protein [Elusimicrobiota bacterium]
MRGAAILAASLLLCAAASAAPLDAFVSAFGESGVATLSERGYVVLQGRGPERRLIAVHWKALEGLAASAEACHRLAPAFAGCRVLPSDGAMTPRLHALADAAAAADEERFALASSSASLAEPDGLPNLFDTAWGKDFAARRGADRVEEPAALAKPFFEDFLGGPRPNADAAKHFVAVETARGASGVDVLLKNDVERGAASDDLRMLLRRYLRDERRRRGLALAEARTAALSAEKDTARDLEALTQVAATLAVKPALLSSLETAVSGAPAPAGVPKLRSAGVHLQDPTRLGQYELGDEAVVSGAYWVDGLDEGASAAIEETTFLETPRGFEGVRTETVKRRNGGPYAFERRLKIDETKNFAVVAYVSAASGTVVTERAEVPVAPDYELSLKKEAEALQYAQSCDPKSAEAAYAALAELVSDAAKVKPQYRGLLERANAGRKEAASEAALLAKLEEAVSDARADSSPQQCAYGASRTDAAIALARKLPSGCDRVLPELFAQRAAISRRAADQKWFLKASDEARARRRACDFIGAARRWDEALAVLETDPAARCGKADFEAKTDEAELPEVRRAAAWSEALGKTVDKAEAETVPAKRLALLAPALARIDSLEDRDCRRDLRKRAEKLAAAAGDAETGPADDDAARRLPADATLAAVTEDVRRARGRLLEKSDAASAPESAPAAPAPAPAPKKPVRAKRKTKPQVQPQ